MRLKRHNSEGSTLIITIVLTAVIGFTLTSYLSLVSNQNLSIMRSMAWNSAIPIAEAGVEEAMAHLNRNGTNRVKDGWKIDGTNVVKQRSVGQNSYRVAIARDMDPPVITCEATVFNPANQELITEPRIVRVGTTNKGIFVKAMVAKGQIDLNGNNIKTDSFDSDDPNHSNGGKYDATKAKSNGDVATNSSMIDSLNVWNADIYGKVSTGPGGTVKIGPNGAVGDKAWHDGGNKGIKPGWGNDDMNVQFPDVELPFQGTGFAPIANQNGYRYTLDSGDYELNTLSLSGKEKVLIRGKAVLLVRGNVSMAGQSVIEIASGASLQMYVAGPSTSLAGNGIMNANSKASSFGYWGLNSNTSVSMSGNGSFTGTIYAPHAALKLSGGGSGPEDFIGASVTKTVTMNGHFQFHYDEALGKIGPRTGYTVISWNEIARHK